MKKLFLFFMLFSFMSTCNAQTLMGGIKYSQEDARIELQNNKPSGDFIYEFNNFVDPNYENNINAVLKGITNFKDRTLGIFSDKTYAINYKKDPLHVWYYDKSGTLINAEVKTSAAYPYRTYKYDSDGSLVSMTMRVSENETFIFSPHGKLLGHWLGENCYNQSGEIIMTRKVLK